MWGTASAAVMPSFETQARRIGTGGVVGTAKSRVGRILPSVGENAIPGDGIWDNPYEWDPGGDPGFGSLDGRNFWEMKSDDDADDTAVIYQSNTYGINLAALPMMRIKFSLNQLPSLCMWHGFFSDPSHSSSTGKNVVATDDPDGDYAGIRYSTAAPDSTWKFCTSNNDVQTVADSGVTVVAGAVYFAEIEMEVGAVRFRIEDATGAVLNEQTVSLTTPRIDIAMIMVHGLSTREAVTKWWRIYFQETYMQY